jgi:hypothetical protein
MMWPAWCGPKVHRRTAPVGLAVPRGEFEGGQDLGEVGERLGGQRVDLVRHRGVGNDAIHPLAAESLLDQDLQVDGVGVGVVSGALDLLSLGQDSIGGAGVAEFEVGGVAPLGQ